jgi:ATP-dependent Clp protease ATP-binding subunit ClpC
MQTIGFGTNTLADDYRETKEKVLGSLKDFFRPEFINRLDETIVFDVLSPEVIREIVLVGIQRVVDRMKAKDISISFTDRVYDYLVEKGYDPQFGARPLNRLIQTAILNKVANLIISGDIKAGSSASVDMKNGELVVETRKKKSSLLKPQKQLAAY